MSGWATPYFSLGSMGCIKDEVSSQNRADSPQGYVWALELKSIQYNSVSASERVWSTASTQRCSTRPGEHDMCCAGLVCIRMFCFVLLCVCACVYPCFALFHTVWLVCDLLSRMGVYPFISWKVGPHRSGALC